MTLEDYLRQEYARGRRVNDRHIPIIDFRLRVAICGDSPVEIYIHPDGCDGDTTPTLLVEGNTVRMHPGSRAPGWER